MNKPNVRAIFKTVGDAVTKHSPEILTGVGIAGMVTTTVLAVGATPKALKLIDAKKKEERLDELTPIETVKTCWKPYIPAVATGLFSIACLIGANSVHARRNAALATAYQLSSTALTEYKDKVVETIGEKKEKEVRDSINKDHIDKNPVSPSEVIITDKGNTLCYEHLSGRYFKSDIDRIRKAENELNKRMLNDMYISLNEFYDELDLDHTRIGDELGWNIDHGLIDIHFSAQLADDETPCIVVDFQTPPYYGYNRLS